MNGENLIIKSATKYKDGTGYSISTTTGCGFFLDAKWGVIPKAKDNIVLYTLGSTVRGLDINGKKVFYKTDQQLEDDRQKMLERMRQEKEDEFKKSKPVLDARFNALPQFFKDRIRRFRENNSKFRIEYESYEMFCCEEAIKFLKYFKTKEEVEAFSKADYNEQKKMVPDMSDDHSGNTFGSACQLAWLYLDNPKNVVLMHGALSTLVGSEDYGDIPNENSKLRQTRRMKLRSLKTK